MEEKKLTDEEIVTALENCLYGDYKTKCKGCRYYDEREHYCQDMDKDALNLIRRLQAEKDTTYNNGFDRGVKAAVEKMRAYLPPRDVDDYPDAIPSHWQLDEVLRQLLGDK